MGVLDDMLDDAGAKPASGAGLGEVIGRAVAAGRPALPPRSEEMPDLAPIASLGQAVRAALLRYLGADDLVPLLGRAPVSVAQSLVEVMDAESQAWLAAQSDAFGRVTEAAHAAAARRALGLVERAVTAAARAVQPTPSPASEPPRPVQVGVAFSGGGAIAPVAPAPAPAPVPTPAPPADDLIETLATLVALASGRDAAALRELAAETGHPVLSTGLHSIADGCDGHAVDAAVRAASATWLEQQQRQLDCMRQALLSIRFGDGPDAFRRRATSAV
jgi:hypothetical protein